MGRGGRHGEGDWKDGARREPHLSPHDRSGVSVSPDDRVLDAVRVRGGSAAKLRGGTRREPTFDHAPPVGAPAGPMTGRRGQADAPSRRGRAKPRRRSLLGTLGYWGVVLGLWALVAAGGFVAYEVRDLPPIDQLAVPKRPPNIAVLARDGQLLANRGSTGGAAVTLRDLPAFVPQAFIAIEDRRFYTHWGIDPLGIARALLRNAGGGAVQGGSTLTQQLAKNLFLTQERTVSRKVQEAMLALWLEHKFTKKQILELYLNRVYFGSGAYGIEAAAHRYFAKDAKELTVPEAAMLAGLMKAPTKLAPNRNPAAARERAAQVVAAMREEGYLTEAAARQALAKPAAVARERGDGSANYVADYVTDTLDDIVGAFDSDIVVTTTVDPAVQAAAERALAAALDKDGPKLGVSQGALVAEDPTGAIRALVGGRAYADSQFDRAVAAKRQPGSAFKPFVYLAALERGLTPDTVRSDAPIDVQGWQPENYSRRYMGPVTLQTALAQSLNTVAVRLGLEVGPKAVIGVARRLGIQSPLEPNASIALGTSEVSPLELVTAYVPFGNGGLGVQAHIVSSVRTTAGRLLYQRKSTGTGRVIDKAIVGMMDGMMRETLVSGTARKADLPGWQAAGKTGTSQDWRDAWFVGTTSALTAGVWLGNDDGAPTRKASGGGLPVEIWSRFMQAALRGVPPTPLPGSPWRAPAPALAPAADPLLGAVADLLSGTRSGPAPTPPSPDLAQAPSRAASAPVHAEGGDDGLPPATIPIGPDGSVHREGRSILDKLFDGG